MIDHILFPILFGKKDPSLVLKLDFSISNLLNQDFIPLIW